MKKFVLITMLFIFTSTIFPQQPEGDLGPVGGWEFLHVWCSWFDTTNSSFSIEEDTSSKYALFEFYGGTDYVSFVNIYNIQLNTYKDFWESNYQTPDTFVFELNLFEIEGNIRYIVITVGLQDSFSHIFGLYSYFSNLEPGWQTIKITDQIMKDIPIFGRFYFNVYIETFDSCYAGAKIGMRYFGGIDDTLGIMHYDTFGNPPPLGFKEDNDLKMPSNLVLEQNYPNPFNPSTSIRFSIPNAGLVMLKVYNSLGQEVANLVDGFMDVGNHKVDFNAYNLTTGVYFYKLQVGDFVEIKKMLLIK